MAILVRNELDGPFSYCAGYVVPAQSSDSESVHPLRALRGTPTEESVQTLTIDVAEGVSCLMGSVTTDDGSYPTGVTVTVTDPDGNPVGPSQTDARFVVCVANDPTMVQSCTIQDPVVGRWTVTVTNADSSSYVFFSTLPTEAQYTTIIDTLAPHIDPGPAKPGPEGSVACTICQVACWTLAIALTFLLVLVAGLITAASGPVGWLVALLGSIGIVMLPATALVVVQALLAAVGATVFMVVENLCSWLNACSTGVTAKMTSPRAGSTVSGTTQLSASSPDAVTVSFYVDGNTLIGTDNIGPSWDTDWDTTKFDNGVHTVWALATGSSGAAFSPQVNVTVSN
ncbi:Ig-like domain-containing protein [Streptomyces gardneri]|uniref:Ig-like domain-containing protein n=1 Tax=Streptomyces gardneri TaxID=66892 RepID=UPI003698E6B2